MKKKLLTFSKVFILFLFFFNGNAQIFDWVIEPTITDVDEIIYDQRQSIYDAIIVKKGNKYGIKSIQNEILAPVTYKSIVYRSNGLYFGLQDDTSM